MPVIAGAGSNSTAEAIELSRACQEGRRRRRAAFVTRYYNKPTQEGLYQHFKAISDAVDIPIFIYNVPARTIVDMSVATMARCAELKNVVGVKDATANVARVSQQRLAMRQGLHPALGRGRAPRSASWRTAATAASR